MATIRSTDALAKDLSDLVKAVPAFAKSGYYAFDIESLEAVSQGDKYPIAGVIWNGCAPVQPEQGKASADRMSQTATFLEHQFLLVIGIQDGASNQENKATATNLLDECRQSIMGQYGNKGRPWIWMGDKPEPEAGGAGVVYYVQMWHTRLPIVGKPPVQSN